MEVSKYQKYGKSWYERNREKELIRAKEAYKTKGKPEESKLYYMTYRYGITLDDYENMLAQQNNQCAICGKTPTTKRLDIDHCHDSGTIRGLLCNNCNRGIGHFKNNVKSLENAIKYLNEQRSITGHGGTCGV